VISDQHVVCLKRLSNEQQKVVCGPSNNTIFINMSNL